LFCDEGQRIEAGHHLGVLIGRAQRRDRRQWRAANRGIQIGEATEGRQRIGADVCHTIPEGFERRLLADGRIFPLLAEPLIIELFGSFLDVIQGRLTFAFEGEIPCLPRDGRFHGERVARHKMR